MLCQLNRRKTRSASAATLTAALALLPAKVPALTQSITCQPTIAASALPVCDRLGGMLTASGWLDKRPGATISIDVVASTATRLQIALTVTAADGRSTRIDRALSVSDTTMTSAMQDRFLHSLLTALPTDF